MLAWDEKDNDSADTAVPLSPKSTQTLYELGMPSEPDRCYLYLQDGPDAPPVRVDKTAASNADRGTDVGGAVGQGEAGGQGIVLAGSVSTASPSAHSLSNTSSSNMWSSSSSYHYPNKSDTG